MRADIDLKPVALEILTKLGRLFYPTANMTRLQNTMALRLKELCKPGTPLSLYNVYDAGTAKIVAARPASKALATTSYGVAASQGYTDDELPFELNIAGIREIAVVAREANLPLTVDLQDGYEDVEDTITRAINAGAVGCNLEDTTDRGSRMRSTEQAAGTIADAIRAASKAGVPDFVINARTDVLGHGGSIADAIERGRAYLAAGAVTIFVWGGLGGRGVSRDEVTEIVQALGGMVNVRLKLASGYLKAGELASLGVARLSIGPDLYLKAMEALKRELPEEI